MAGKGKNRRNPEGQGHAGGDLICLGVVTGVHGLRGEVIVKSFTAMPENIAAYGPLLNERGEPVCEIASLRAAKKGLIARLEGVSSRNEAEALKGERLHIARARLPELDDEDEFYHTDLIGLEARTTKGKPLGEVVALHDFGAGDLIEIRLHESGKSEIWPFNRQTVPEIHLAEGFLVINPPQLIETGPGQP